MTTIKVTEVKIGGLPKQPAMDVAPSNEQMFGCEFPELEGIQVEKNQASQPQEPKTYCKTYTNEYEEKVTEIYNSDNNSLISRKTDRNNGKYTIETFAAGTKIITKMETYNDENELEQLTEFHNSAPFKKSKETDYKDGKIYSEHYYNNNNANSRSQTIYHYDSGNMKYKFLGYGSDDIIIGVTEYYPDNTIKSDIQENKTGRGFVKMCIEKTAHFFQKVIIKT